MTNHTTLSAQNAALAELQRDLAAFVKGLAEKIDEMEANDRLMAVHWLIDGARLPSGRVIRIAPDPQDDIYTMAFDAATGERIASATTEARVWQKVEDLVREGELT